MTERFAAEGIHFPPRYQPGRTPVHVSNELNMTVPCEQVWAWLVRADLWPSWYVNASNVRLDNRAGAAGLALGTRFRWKTFGVTIDSVTEEFVPCERIAWTGRASGVDVYHAWLLRPSSCGCHVVTEETQRGWLATLGHLLRPRRMHRYHQIWLEALQAKAAGGLPPPRG